MSKIDEGKLVLEHEPFVLNEIMENIVAGLRSNAQDKGVDLILDLHGMRRLTLVGDSMRLSQVLINFVSNALKFTDARGSVRLGAEIISEDREKALLSFAVQDTGIGMSEDAIAHVFKPFEQANASIARKYGGTGLGLSISRNIVELMGSEIKVESREGVGSKFSFRAWFDVGEETEPAPRAAAKDEAPDFSGRNVLVVDDVDINREIIAFFLDGAGANTEFASDGKEAVELFEASAEGYYDLILMDVRMPVMDGCEATRAIRALERPDAATVSIIAMTANAFKEDMQMVVKAGMNGHISKPVEYETAMDVIAKAFRKK
jgi:CheY-like chemotaxis protein